MPSPTIPVDIVNRALDECGLENIGDFTGKAGQVAERMYWPVLRQMFAAAHWNFARRDEELICLADVSGELVAETDVPPGWAYMYDWPVDAVCARWVPATWGGSDASPYFFGTTPTAAFAWNRLPAPFLVVSAPRLNELETNWFEIEGHDPEQTRVIVTNQPSARLVYTGLLMYPDAWDPLFEQAMVAALAVRFAMPLIEDKKFARIVRSDNAQIATQALNAARVRDGNEGWTVQTHVPDWISARWSGAGWNGAGQFYYGWSSVPWLEAAGGVF